MLRSCENRGTSCHQSRHQGFNILWSILLVLPFYLVLIVILNKPTRLNSNKPHPFSNVPLNNILLSPDLYFYLIQTNILYEALSKIEEFPKQVAFKYFDSLFLPLILIYKIFMFLLRLDIFLLNYLFLFRIFKEIYRIAII